MPAYNSIGETDSVSLQARVAELEHAFDNISDTVTQSGLLMPSVVSEIDHVRDTVTRLFLPYHSDIGVLQTEIRVIRGFIRAQQGNFAPDDWVINESPLTPMAAAVKDPLPGPSLLRSLMSGEHSLSSIIRHERHRQH